MTIPKRDKRKRRGVVSTPASPKNDEIYTPPMDKMVHNYYRECRWCGKPSNSSRCVRCGGLTVITKGG